MKQKYEMFFWLFLIIMGTFLGIVTAYLYFYSDIQNAQKIVNIKNEYEVDFSDELVDKLNDLYFNTSENEFSVCLIGIQQNATFIYVDDYSKFLLGNATGVAPLFCTEPNEIGTLHKHPRNTSYQSHQDVVFSKSIFNKQQLFSIIMYQPCKFNIFTPINWYYGEKRDEC